MKKWLILICFFFLTNQGFSKETVEGLIISSSSDRLYISTGDLAQVSIGFKEGLIKGDILSIRKEGKNSTVGRCAVEKVGEESLCTVISAREEIEGGDIVVIEKLESMDKKLYPFLYSVLSIIVEPYEPYKRITIFLHEIFDSNKNVTEFSRRLKKEMEYMFSQKKRIILRENANLIETPFYPDTLSDMERLQAVFRDGVDVFIVGSYEVQENFIHVNLYEADKTYGRQTLTFKVPLDTEHVELSKVIEPYRHIEKKEPVTLTVLYKARGLKPSVDLRRLIVSYESDGDPFKENILLSSNFNIVAPTEAKMFLNGNSMRLDQNQPAKTLTTTSGTHRVRVSFKRGYFQNSKDLCIYVSPMEVTKEALVNLQEGSHYVLEIIADPSIENGQNIRLRVFKEEREERMVLREIEKFRVGASIEYFK